MNFTNLGLIGADTGKIHVHVHMYNVSYVYNNMHTIHEVQEIPDSCDFECVQK